MKGYAKLTGRVYFNDPMCGKCGAVLKDRGFWSTGYTHPMNGCEYSGKVFSVSYMLPVELEEIEP
jgi:hypothetical protein